LKTPARKSFSVNRLQLRHLAHLTHSLYPPPYNLSMASRKTFFTTDPTLTPILDELRPLEPIFHTPDFGLEPADFERRTAPDYWEVGASGRRYSRDFILQMLADSPPANALTLRWRTSGHALRQLSPDTFLLTYSLRQEARLIRRSTLWQRTPHRLADPLLPKHHRLRQRRRHPTGAYNRSVIHCHKFTNQMRNELPNPTHAQAIRTRPREQNVRRRS